MISSSQAYNQHETRHKQLLDRDLDRSWCHLHISVKLSWPQPMAPWTLAAAYECAAIQSMDLWAVTKKALYYCEGDTTPVRVPTQQLLILSFT